MNAEECFVYGIDVDSGILQYYNFIVLINLTLAVLDLTNSNIYVAIILELSSSSLKQHVPPLLLLNT